MTGITGFEPGTPQLEMKHVVGSSPLGPLGNTSPLEFCLRAGECGVVFGGKETSSLFRLIMGTGKIDLGAMVLENQYVRDADSRAEGKELSQWRQRIGFGFREKGLLSNLTLMDNVDLPAKYHDCYAEGMAPGEIAARALTDADVEKAQWNWRPDRINWEVRKRVLLARSIVLDPKVLILDDPSALLSSPTLPKLMRWIEKQKKRGRGVLIGTNDYPFGLAVADWVLHPTKNNAVKDYSDFIEDPWIRSAELLKSMAAAVDP
jgi:ABC-type ATPase involved in cell division